MSEESSYNSRRRDNRHHRDDRYHRGDRHHRDDSRHYDYRRTRDRDSRDSYRNDSHQRRVPGLVSDPDSHLGDVDKAIQRGQRETVSRVHSGRANYYKPARDPSPAVDYQPPISTVTQPYYRSPYKTESKKSRRYFYNPSFLSVLPGVIGFAVILSAIILPTWLTVVKQNSDGFRIVNQGLFQICALIIRSGDPEFTECTSLEANAEAGSAISPLEQATRGLIIISLVIGLISTIASVVFGIRRTERKKGPFITAGLYAFAGICGVAGVGCFSAFFVQSVSAESSSQQTLPGTSFYLAWFGVGMLILASITALMGHFAKAKK